MTAAATPDPHDSFSCDASEDLGLSASAPQASVGAGGFPPQNAMDASTARRLAFLQRIAPYALCAVIAVLGIGASWRLNNRQPVKNADHSALFWSDAPLSGSVSAPQNFRQTARIVEEPMIEDSAANAGEVRAEARNAAAPERKLEASARRIERSVERLAQRVERLERLMSDPTPTGSLSTPREEAAGYVLQKVENGVAYFHTAHGQVEARVGDTLPKLGKIRAIENREGRWMAFTPTAVIAMRSDAAKH